MRNDLRTAAKDGVEWDMVDRRDRRYYTEMERCPGHELNFRLCFSEPGLLSTIDPLIRCLLQAECSKSHDHVVAQLIL